MASDLLVIFILTSLAGACIPVGGVLASFERILPRWLERELRHFIIAMGGGILLGAVSEVLLPEGRRHLESAPLVLIVFIAGGVCFFLVERLLELRRREAPQLLGLLLDYIPEAVALGGMVALDAASAPLLAFLIGLQNIPEGFNAFRELVSGDHQTARKTLLVMTSLVLIGPLAGACGYLFLAHAPKVLGSIMVFAAGGILYLIFQDIAPQSRLDRHWAPPLGAIIGFGIVLLGQMITAP